ncbi:hypothetical protein WR25_03300 isoform E [Diploscapter pachys]|nr:hypothetical protein WR25_03300 isoform B [Diploscapter pachys]PAV80667.1 hypothetical protein WR25_03300 isoform D [Diploscapter pachys]PAV80668.1 hypothetical protein WR25_03300 isoform E [Diploscapter pachys]
MEKCSSRIEEIFLDQVRLVAPGMIVPLWVSSGVHAAFKIEKIHPEPRTPGPVYLVPSTELYIVPVTNGKIPMSKQEKRSSDNEISKMQHIFTRVHESIAPSSLFSTLSVRDFVLRILPRKFVTKSKNLAELSHPNVIYCLANKRGKKEIYTSYGIVQISSNCNKKVSNLKFAILVCFPYLNDMECHGLHRTVLGLLKSHTSHCITNSKSLPEYTSCTCTSVNRKKIHILNNADILISQKQYEKIKSNGLEKPMINEIVRLCSVYPILMPINGINIELSMKELENFTIRLAPSILDISKIRTHRDKLCYMVNEGCKLHVQEPDTESKEDQSSTEVVEPECYGIEEDSKSMELSCQQPIIDQICHWANYSTFEDQKVGHFLLLGISGSGKSMLLQKSAEKLTNSRSLFYASYYNCSNWWKGKNAETIEKVLSEELKRLVSRKPSVLFLDDIDFLNNIAEEEHRQVAIEKVFNALHRQFFHSEVTIVATAKKLLSLHRILFPQGGKRLFGEIVEVPTLSQADRTSIIKSFVGSDEIPDVLSARAARSTDNFSIADLKKLSIRLKIEANINGNANITEEDLSEALKYSKSIGDSSKKTKAEKTVTLDDVGGMHQQKQLMIEVVIWPYQYSELYESVGIRLGRGVLLHGPSGCGKTLLANAIASYSKFNVISVKGPELLSKYIGSSEENVRTVFERARAASPCVVIFDELDSLAPIRGSDSTGVTDRVVNQLLTEIDGAEGLQGVFIIGCTSRVDLIDPALLRPGRFDHLVECKYPDEKDRRETLKIILGDVSNSEDVDVDGLAKRTDGWSGADLMGLITNAQFDAEREQSVEEPILKMTNIDAVFEESKPKPREKKRQAFRAGQKVTLA